MTPSKNNHAYAEFLVWRPSIRYTANACKLKNNPFNTRKHAWPECCKLTLSELCIYATWSRHSKWSQFVMQTQCYNGINNTINQKQRHRRLIVWITSLTCLLVVGTFLFITSPNPKNHTSYIQETTCLIDVVI